LIKTIEIIESLAKEIDNLRLTTLALTNALKLHNQAIFDLYAKQQAILRAMAANSIDVKLSDGDKEKFSKPN
jgi:hypothetical protein